MTGSAEEVLGKIASEGGEGGFVFVLTGLGGSEEEGVAEVSLLGEVGLPASVSDSAMSIVEVSRSLI